MQRVEGRGGGGSSGMIDALDIERPEALVEYLQTTGRLDRSERPRVHLLSGGISNRTVLVERESGEAWVLKQALDRLRVGVEWFSDPERVHREASGMRWLAELAPAGAIPELLFEDHQHHLLAMRAIPQPHENWKSLLLAGRLEACHVEQFGALLGTIHRRGYEERDRVVAEFDDRTFFASLRVEPYFRYAALQLPAAAEFLNGVIEAMEPRRFTLVHGDYSPKNVLVARERFVLVDHETIHFGDPAFDVGFSLTHLLSKANHLPRLRSDFAAAAASHWRAYRSVLGSDVPWTADLEPHVVRQTLACLIARAAGRSKLEYLDAAALDRQRNAACGLLHEPPGRVEELIETFVARL